MYYTQERMIFLNKIYIVVNDKVAKVVENLPSEKFYLFKKFYGILKDEEYADFINNVKEVLYPEMESFDNIQAVALADSCTHCGKLTNMIDWSYCANDVDKNEVWNIISKYDSSLQLTELWHSPKYINPAEHNGLEYANICDACWEKYSDKELGVTYDED